MLYLCIIYADGSRMDMQGDILQNDNFLKYVKWNDLHTSIISLSNAAIFKLFIDTTISVF